MNPIRVAEAGKGFKSKHIWNGYFRNVLLRCGSDQLQIDGTDLAVIFS
jgi:hypothetical protein